MENSLSVPTIKEFPQWTDLHLCESYKVTFKLLGPNILLSIPEGETGQDGMLLLLKSREHFLKEIGLFEKAHIEIKDYGKLYGGINRLARHQFTEFLQTEQDRGCLKAFFGFNASLFVRSIYNLGLSTFSHKMIIKVYNDFEQALFRAIEVLKGVSVPKEPPLLGLAESKKEVTGEDIRKLYSYISSINWDNASTEVEPKEIPDNHPLKPVYGALELLKSDFFETVHEQQQTETHLKDFNRKIEKSMELRTRRLMEKNTILETSLNILSHDTKNLFLNISCLIDQELKEPQQSMFKESYNELYESVMEASGYIRDQKRIFSLVDQIDKIKVTDKRIPLPDYRGIQVVVKGEKEDFYLDSSLIFKNAILNLLENAIKYTPEEKMIILALSRCEDLIIIEVQDRGKGIPDEEKKVLCEKGYRRHEDMDKQGTGRGLWITRNIIEKSCGKLKILDNPGGGTIFRIEVPAFHVYKRSLAVNNLSEWFHIPVDDINQRFENIEMLLEMNKTKVRDLNTYLFLKVLQNMREENKKKSSINIRYKLEKLKKMNPSGKKVLIVDDSLFVHYYLATYFTELGFRIIGFEFNGADGLDTYFKLNPDYITLDNTMPVMTGIEAGKKIFSKDKEARILFITALGDSTVIQEDIKRSIDQEHYRIMAKPFSKDQLSAILASFGE